MGGGNALFISSSVRDFFVVLQMYPVYSLESHLHQNDQLWQQPSNTVRCCYNTIKNPFCRHRSAAIMPRYGVSLMGSYFDVGNASVITEVMCEILCCIWTSLYNKVVAGYIGFTPFICPSVHPILSSNFRRCVTCKVSCEISKFEFLANF